MPEHFYRLSEAAALLSCSVDSLRRWEQEGVLVYTRLCGQRVVTERDLKTIRAHRAAPGRRRKQTAQRAVSAQT
jgi:DNA-binding transcriptional MerR regulator